MMDFWKLLFLLMLGMFVLALILFPGFRSKLLTLCGGMLNLFVEDRAKTPDGARAIYQQAIEEAQEQYNEASEMLSKTSGRYELAKRDLTKLKSELQEVETKCEVLVKSGKIDLAQTLAEKREDILISIDGQNRIINDLKPMVEDAKMIADQKERTLKKLKSDSKRKIAELEMNQQMGEMFDQMDDLKRKSAVSKLLDSVDEGCNEARQKAVGSRVVHESRLDTKARRAAEEANKGQTSDYIKDLQKRLNINK